MLVQRGLVALCVASRLRRRRQLAHGLPVPVIIGQRAALRLIHVSLLNVLGSLKVNAPAADFELRLLAFSLCGDHLALLLARVVIHSTAIFPLVVGDVLRRRRRLYDLAVAM